MTVAADIVHYVWNGPAEQDIQSFGSAEYEKLADYCRPVVDRLVVLHIEAAGRRAQDLELAELEEVPPSLVYVVNKIVALPIFLRSWQQNVLQALYTPLNLCRWI